MALVDVDRAPVTSTAARDAAWRHVSGLDGLRAFAVVAVLLFHGGYLEGGFLGVDLFFALSGFLITSLLIRDAGGPGVRLGAFWGRRFRRLLPAVFALLVVVALWAAAFGSPAELETVRRDGAWALGYLANWHAIASSGGYWQSFDQPGMFDHLWSLAIEEQFYLLWPLVVVAVWRWAPRPSRALTAVCVLGIVASMLTMFLLTDPAEPTRVYMGTDTRAASLLFGALAATAPCRRLVARLIAWLGGAATAAVVVLGAAVLWSWVAVDGAGSALLYRGGLALHSAACALVVAMVATAPSAPAARVLGCRPLAWIGVMSYGLYLWHWPVYIVLSPDRTGLDGVVLLALRIAVAAGFAVASYWLVENPIRHRAAWTRNAAAVPALAASVVLVALVLAALPTPAKEIAAFDPASIAATTVAPPAPAAPATTTIAAAAGTTPPVATRVPPAPTAAAQPAPVAAPAPTAAPTTAAPPVVTAPPLLAPIGHAIWTGDSIAWDMAPGVGAALRAADVAIDPDEASVGLRIIEPDEFTDLANAVRGRLEEDGTDTVLMQLSTWDGRRTPAEQQVALEAMRQLVVQHGARLVIIRPPIVADEITNAGVATMSDAARALAAADPANVRYLDPTDVWGPAPVLDLDGDGTPERKRDLTHVCPAGAARFGAWLAGALAATFEGVTPASPETWAGGSWVEDDRYDMPVGACAPVG